MTRGSASRPEGESAQGGEDRPIDGPVADTSVELPVEIRTWWRSTMISTSLSAWPSATR